MKEVEHNKRRIVGLLGNKIIDEVGKYDAKYNKTVSQASHFIDVMLLGINTYVHDVQTNGLELDKEKMDVLACGLALHDVDKVINQKEKRDELETKHITADDRNDDGDVMETTPNVLKEYFEHDWFNVESFLNRHSDDPIDEYEDILYYLIKRTEKRDNIENLPPVPPSYRKLTRYCEIADTTVSVMTNETDVTKGQDALLPYYDDSQIHTLELTQLERPILHFIIIESLKDYLNEENYTVLGSTPTGILYLGDNEVNKESIVDSITQKVREKIANDFNFGCKAKFRSVNYNALPTVEIPLREKRKIIANTYIKNTIKRNVCDTVKFESLPDDFVDYLPEILHMLYQNKHYEYEDDDLQDTIDEIQENNHGSKYKVLMIHRVLSDYDELGEAFIQEAKEWTDDLEDVLTPDESPLTLLVERVLQLNLTVNEVPDAENTCVMCGRHATTEYKGNTVFQTQGYSKRTAYEQNYKKICSVCQMEHALMNSLVEQSEAYGDEIEMVYFYFDTFSSDIGLEETAGEVTSDILDSDVAFDDESDGLGAVNLYEPLVHFQPITLESNDSDRNKKLRTVKRILKKIQSTGMKARITTPFRPFEMSQSVFIDNNPIEQQKIIDATKVERYDDVDRLLDLFKIAEMFGAETEESFNYRYVIPDTAENLIHNTVKKLNDTPTAVTLLGEYVHNYCKMSEMNNLAKAGISLYGEQHGSKYKKQKVIREGIESLLEARHNEYDERRVIDEVAGSCLQEARTIVPKDGYAQAESAEEFAESLVKYCSTYDLAELTQKQNEIANTYLFAYEKQMYGGNNESK